MIKDRIERIKLHVVENKKYYLIGAGGIIVGAAGMYFFRNPQVITKNVSLLSYKPTQSNTVIVSLTRRGHPGNIVRCLETGEAFASQKRAAIATGVSPGNLSRHLSGKLPHVKGLHFENLGEAAA